MPTNDRQILRLAIPSIVSNITVPLLGMVDVAIVGHLGDASYIGAIAVGAMIFNVIYWIFGFLRMGTSGMTAQALGARQLTDVVQLLMRSFSVGLMVALTIIVFQTPIKQLALAIVAPEQQIRSLVSTYFYICVWGAPAMLAMYGLTGWYIGMQNTRFPMVISIVQNVVNIVASLLMVFVFRMGIRGVAFGTVVAQYAGLILSLSLLWSYYRRWWKYMRWEGLYEKAKMLRFFKVNSDIFIRTLFLVAVNFYFLAAGSRQGAVVLAVNTLLMQLFILFSYVMDGFAFAGEALCGKYFGAENHSAFQAVLKRLFVWGGIVVIAFTILYLVGGQSFLSLFTDDKEVLNAATEYFPWAIVIPVAGVAAFIWDGVFIGITETRGMLYSSVIATIIFFMVYIILRPVWHNHALWLAFILYLISRGVIQSIIFRYCKKVS